MHIADTNATYTRVQITTNVVEGCYRTQFRFYHTFLDLPGEFWTTLVVYGNAPLVFDFSPQDEAPPLTEADWARKHAEEAQAQMPDPVQLGLALEDCF